MKRCLPYSVMADTRFAMTARRTLRVSCVMTFPPEFASARKLRNCRRAHFCGAVGQTFDLMQFARSATGFCGIAPHLRDLSRRRFARHAIPAYKKSADKAHFGKSKKSALTGYEKDVLTFFLRHSRTRHKPIEPTMTHAGHIKISSASGFAVSGKTPVMIVMMSEVAMLACSPVPRATTASADAAKTAITKQNQPVNLPKNMTPRRDKKRSLRKA